MSTIKAVHERMEELFKETSFRGCDPTWKGMSIVRNSDGEADRVRVPECSYLGHTNIVMSHDYENDGMDCLFISELLQLWKEGKLLRTTCHEQTLRLLQEIDTNAALASDLARLEE